METGSAARDGDDADACPSPKWCPRPRLLNFSCGGRTLSPAMLRLVLMVLLAFVRALGSSRDLVLENLALRQQLAAYALGC